MPASRRSLYYKGKRAEHQLVRYLQKRGWAVMRAPASGRRSKRLKYPDVVAVKDGRTLIFEVKFRSRLGTVYLYEEQVEALRWWAKRSGGDAYIAIKLPEWRSFKVVPLDQLEPHERIGVRMYRVTVEKIRNAKWLWEILQT